MAEGEKRKIPSWFQTADLSPPLPPESAAAGNLSGEAVEEEKMERFCKLIEDMIVERELWLSSFLNGRKKQKREGELWKPKFEWEDFAGESHGRSSAVKNRRDERKRNQKEGKEEESGVDLNLGL